MREVKRGKKSGLAALAIWSLFFQLIAPGISAAAEPGADIDDALISEAESEIPVTDAVYQDSGMPVTDAVYQIENPGFETGDLTGWSVAEGGAFGPDSVSDETVWWAERIPYDQEGAYHLNGWKYPESETGVLRSSTFELGGSGWISFKLGGAKDPDKAFINIVEADTGQVVARYGNSAFSDVGFPDPAQGMRLANMEQYKADLSGHIGKKLYIEIVDHATSDWGLIFADAFFMYHESEPAEGIVATDIKPDFERYQIENPSFETGDLTGWTVIEGDAFGPNSVSDETVWWAERIPYDQEGAYHLNGWKYPESETGVLRSSTFELGGSGWITFKLGGGKHTDQVYVSVIEAETGNLIADTATAPSPTSASPIRRKACGLPIWSNIKRICPSISAKNCISKSLTTAYRTGDWSLRTPSAPFTRSCRRMGSLPRI